MTRSLTSLARCGKQRWDADIGHLERETFDAFLQLPAPQREVILTFAKVHADADPAA